MQLQTITTAPENENSPRNMLATPKRQESVSLVPGDMELHFKEQKKERLSSTTPQGRRRSIREKANKIQSTVGNMENENSPKNIIISQTQLSSVSLVSSDCAIYSRETVKSSQKCESLTKDAEATQPDVSKSQEAESEFKNLERNSSATLVASQASTVKSDSFQGVTNEQKTNQIIMRLREFAAMCERSTAEQLLNDFNTLPKPDMRACKACHEPQNLKKNRYSNIPCLDSTRILLTFLRHEVGSGYIHANRIEYPTLRNKYIITQGPLPNTVVSFWQMVWQENVYCIVMLCQTIEDGKRKSAEYFSPRLDDVVSYGQLVVTLKDRKWEDNIIMSTLEVEYLQESRLVTHYQWRDWSDWTILSAVAIAGGDPENIKYKAPIEQTLINLLQKVRGKSAVVVHCSAGVGRSGTFMALEMCLQDLANGIPVNVHQVVSSLRRYRALAVQTFEQYLSIHRAILCMAEKHGAITKNDVMGFYRMCEAVCER